MCIRDRVIIGQTKLWQQAEHSMELWFLCLLQIISKLIALVRESDLKLQRRGEAHIHLLQQYPSQLPLFFVLKIAMSLSVTGF